MKEGSRNENDDRSDRTILSNYTVLADEEDDRDEEEWRRGGEETRSFEKGDRI